MVKKIHYTWKDVEHMINGVVNLMYADNWRPDYIVGLTRGGLVPTTIMSNVTGIMCHTLDTRKENQESNLLDGPKMRLVTYLGKIEMVFTNPTQ